MHLAMGHWVVIIVLGLVLLWGALIFIAWLRQTFLKSNFQSNMQGYALFGVSSLMRTAKTAALALALLFIGFALLDPRWGQKSENAAIEGIDLVFSFDLSRSMLTGDVPPNRLENSKRIAQDLLPKLAGNRIGVTAFAGRGFQVIPLTADIDAASLFIQELSPDMIDLQGTDLEDAIRQSVGLFEKEALTHKAIVLVTDGEDLENSPLEAVKAAREKGIMIFTLGVGTPSGERVPVLSENGQVAGYLEDNGKTVVSRLDEKLLRQIAQESGGEYYPASQDGVASLYNRLEQIEKNRYGQNPYEWMEPQYQWFLLPGILLLFIAFFLPDRRLKSLITKGAPVVLAVFLLLPSEARASDGTQGSSLYRKSQFQDALSAFERQSLKEKEAGRAIFNAGNCDYQLGNFEDAEAAYLKAAQSPDRKVRERSLYNLGNSRLERKQYPQAIDAYREVLNSAKPGSDLYNKALQNLLYAKEQIRQNPSSGGGGGSSSSSSQSSSGSQGNSSGGSSSRSQSSSQSSGGGQSSSSQAKPMTRSELDNILNLIQEEEKKRLQRKEPVRPGTARPRHEW